ncbi:MAG: hypothetical protein ACR2LK_00325 [Solirubrobacteraceae bacterium]
MLMSTLPLQAKRPGGAFAPIDLSLQRANGGVGPKNSLAPFRVDELSAGRVSFPGKGVSVALRGGERRLAQTVSDRAFFAGVMQDTDVGVAPLPDGAELFVIVRSPRAPERFVLEVDLPDGARLRQAVAEDPIANDPPRSLEIVRGKQTLGYIHPPIAIDADRQNVPATMRLQGQRIVLDVEHRDREIRYPINVDPEMRLYSDYSADWLRWSWNQLRFGAGNGSFGAAKNNCAYYCGLYQSVPTNTSLTNGSYAQWFYRAPPKTFLYRATFGGISHAPINAFGQNHTRSFNGLMNGSYSAWESNVNYVNQAGSSGSNPYGPHSGAYYGLTHDFCFNPRCTPKPSGASEQNYALFALQAQNAFGGSGIYSGLYQARNTMAWANVYLGDRRDPSLSSATPASVDWTDDTANTQHTTTVGVHDDGLGIYGIGLNGAASGGGFVRHPCLGHVDRSPCPADWSKTFNYTLDEGVNTMHAYGEDFIGNRTPGSPSGTWTEKIDRSAPEITTVSGALYERRNRDTVNAAAGLYDAEYALSVRAQDAHSGVREIEVKVDDQSVHVADGSSLDWVLRTDDYSEGEHVIEIVARDQLAGQASAERHTSTRSFEVTIDRRGDIYQTDIYVNEAPSTGGEIVNREWARLATNTSRYEDEDQQMTRSIVPCDAAQPSGAQCDQVRMRMLDPDSGERSATDGWTTYTSGDADDPRLERVASISGDLSEDLANYELVQSGPLADALAPWQHAPPDNDGTFELWERSHPANDEQDTVLLRRWVDAKTKLPLRATQTLSSDSEPQLELWWEYRPDRLTDDELRAQRPDGFALDRPSDPFSEENVNFHTDEQPEVIRDAETGDMFKAFHLGDLFSGLSLGWCLASTDTTQTTINEPDDDPSEGATDGPDLDPVGGATEPSPDGEPSPSGDETVFNADYNDILSGVLCNAGKGSRAYPELVVSSTAASSSTAAAWREAYQEAALAAPDPDDVVGRITAGVQDLLVGQNAVTAYVAPFDDDEIAVYAELLGTALSIKGKFSFGDVQTLLQSLITG